MTNTAGSVADRRRKALVQRLMGQGGGGRGTPMPAEGPSFHGVGRFSGSPRTSSTHASNIAQSIIARLGGGMHPGAFGEVSPGGGMPIDRPTFHPTPPGPPINPPIPSVSPPGVVPLQPTGPITTAPGSTGPGLGSPASPVGAPGSSGGVNPTPTPAQSGLLSNAASGVNASFIPLGGGLYYDPSTDTVLGSGSSAGGGSARRL